MRPMEPTELDQALDLLTRYYHRRKPSPTALPQLLDLLQQERHHELADEELDWLAAAGTPRPQDPDKLR